MALPEGTVTLLFTDIEGSTKLWETHPEAMQATLARHDALLREAIEAQEGFVFKTIGDAFCAAFATAPEALATALTAQLAVKSEAWPEPITIRVRMALHTGAVESRDNDYFGQPLNRVARLLSTGHGGQTLLTLATEELVRDSLPPAVSLRDLGQHQLKDLARPEQIYQLQHPQLPENFPALKSLSAFPNNLPQQVTSFIGREKELEEVQRLLAKTRLLTLTGSGGSGKSRLGLQLAADILEDFPDGAFLVELAPLSDPSFVAQTVASVLGLKEEPGKTILVTLTEHLKSKKLLLLLDNCEHVLDVSAKLVDTLIRSCPGVKVLATSREGLGIAGETTYRVPSLSLPDPRQAQTPANLSQYESVRLFIDRALQVQTTFTVTNTNAPALAAVCLRLDGIPLAIELAAARVRSLSVEDINSKLDQRFRLLTGGSRTALPRQQTLRSLIDWSYDLLNSVEKALLCRLSVFSGGWTLEAAEQVCSGEPVEDWEVLDLLTSLCDKSLVLAEPSGSSTRYRLLVTVRQYARERLFDSGTGDAFREKHLNFFLALAEEAEPKLTGPEQTEWFERLEEEHENVRASLDWSNESGTGAPAGLRVASALWRFWYVRGYISEGRERLSRALVGKPVLDRATRAKALNGVGFMACSQADYLAARAYHEESLAICRELGDKRGISTSLNGLGRVAHSQGNYVATQAFYEESLVIFRELGDRLGISSALGNLGLLAHDQGDYASAMMLIEESLTIDRERGDLQGIAINLGNLGNVAYAQGNYSAAQAFYMESLTINRELGDLQGIAANLCDLGDVASEQGDVASAQSLYEESAVILREIGHHAFLANALSGLGDVVASQGEYASACMLYKESLAIRREIGNMAGIASVLGNLGVLAGKVGRAVVAGTLWGAAEALREEIGAPLPSSERAKYDKEVADARAALNDDAAFDAAWQEGRAMSLEQAVALAMKDTHE